MPDLDPADHLGTFQRTGADRAVSVHIELSRLNEMITARPTLSAKDSGITEEDLPATASCRDGQILVATSWHAPGYKHVSGVQVT